jgi:hypothetical protein
LNDKGSAAVQRSRERTRAAVSAAWDGVAASLVAQARAISARGRRWISQLKQAALHMTQPSPKKRRLSAIAPQSAPARGLR